MIEIPDAPASTKAGALVVRGLTYGHLGETEKAIADYTSVIRMPDAPVDLRTIALLYRGESFTKRGEKEKAIADYTPVIESPEMPVDKKGEALLNRGLTNVQLGETLKGLTDWTSLIDMPDAPVDQKARALLFSGLVQWDLGQMQEALELFQSAVRIAPLGSRIQCTAMFYLPHPLIEVGLLDDVSTALRHAFEENDRDCEGYAGTPNDLFWMVLRRGSRDWEKYVAALMPLYVEFDAADKLARGLTQLIERLDEGDFSPGQLDQWNAVWQKHGAAVEGLEIALQCLSAATDAMKTKSDRPLFQLPLEIRPLVRSLLTHSLGRVSDQ